MEELSFWEKTEQSYNTKNNQSNKQYNEEKDAVIDEYYALVTCYLLTTWLLIPGGSMPISQGLSNNPNPEPN